MTEAQMYELLGRKQAALEELTSNYQNLLVIVRGIKDGSVSLDRLTIPDNGLWTLSPAIVSTDGKAA